VAGNRLYTSATILAAEQRILTNAGRRDGRTVREHRPLILALLETASNGLDLNAGQVALVRDMATSGARVQLAIAPAGRQDDRDASPRSRLDKTATAMSIGLAPSAVAAVGLGEQLGAHSTPLPSSPGTSATATPRPGWIASALATLVVIDEAGMADTLSLDAVISHVLDAGGSVRLIGDDQQLAAIGAGGVLRDIEATHGALHLTDLVRFTRPGRRLCVPRTARRQTRGVGFYLDEDRIRVGTTRHHASTPSLPTGPLTAPQAATASCLPPPATWSPSSTSGPDRPARRRDTGRPDRTRRRQTPPARVT